MVTTVDDLGTIRGEDVERTMTNSYPFSVTFPRYAVVNNSEVDVYGPIDVIAAITEQDFDPISKSGTIRLYTSIQYPFLLTVPTINPPTGINSFISLDSNQTGASCTTNPSTSCSQYWLVYLNATQFCQISGDFRAEFTVACQNTLNSTQCPLQGDNVNVTWTSSSSNFCGLVNRNVSLSVALNSYREDYSTAKTGFLMGQTVYFQASSSSSDVTISSTFLMNCTLFVDGNAGVNVLLGGNSSTAGTAQSSAVHPVSNVLTEVSIDITSTYFNPPTDGSIPSVLQCFVGVEYLDVSYSKRTVVLKRSVPTQTDSMEASANFQVSSEENNTNYVPSSSSASNVAVWFGSVLIVAILFAL